MGHPMSGVPWLSNPLMVSLVESLSWRSGGVLGLGGRCWLCCLGCLNGLGWRWRGVRGWLRCGSGLDCDRWTIKALYLSPSNLAIFFSRTPQFGSPSPLHCAFGCWSRRKGDNIPCFLLGVLIHILTFPSWMVLQVAVCASNCRHLSFAVCNSWCSSSLRRRLSASYWTFAWPWFELLLVSIGPYIACS